MGRRPWRDTPSRAPGWPRAGPPPRVRGYPLSCHSRPAGAVNHVGDKRRHTMKVFVAGATGAVGKRLVPLLVEGGFDVVGMTRSRDKEELVRELGAEPAVADGLDRDAVMAAVTSAEPEVVIHEMTGLTGATSFRNFDKEFDLTNRLRTQGTDHLLEAAKAAGAERFIAQSFGNWNYERSGSRIKTEEDPLDPEPPKNQRETLAAIRQLEDAVTGAGGIALRYGILYGPGTAIAADGDIAGMIAKRRFPVVRDGGGVWALTHAG